MTLCLLVEKTTQIHYPGQLEKKSILHIYNFYLSEQILIQHCGITLDVSRASAESTPASVTGAGTGDEASLASVLSSIIARKIDLYKYWM